MRNRIGGSRQRHASIAIAGALLVLAIVVRGQSHVPRIWDDAALDDWATPIAALGVRPAHYTSAEYYPSLEELFDPARLRKDYLPRGWNPYAMKQRAISGHRYGLHLEPDDRRALLAFLRSL